MSAWKCDVCGYVHQGADAPDSCILCGADSEHFSPLAVALSPTEKPTGNRWRCSICDHIHDGLEPPDHCKICSASGNMFEAVSEVVPLCGDTGIEQILILGSGIAGITAAEEARKCTQKPSITLIGK